MVSEGGVMGESDRVTQAREALDMDALKPCPFCGFEARIIEVEETDNRGGFVVCCTGCEASTKVWFPLKDDVTQILRDEWNKRADALSDAQQREIERLQKDYHELQAGAVFMNCEVVRLEALVAQQPTWQPIETAPKDGSPICAGMMHPFWGWVWGRCRWHVDKNEPYGGYFSGDGLQPTRWMPLPSPPSALKDEPLDDSDHKHPVSGRLLKATPVRKSDEP
jgi:Lar family restriction alleviation protein